MVVMLASRFSEVADQQNLSGQCIFLNENHLSWSKYRSHVDSVCLIQLLTTFINLLCLSRFFRPGANFFYRSLSAFTHKTISFLQPRTDYLLTQISYFAALLLTNKLRLVENSTRDKRDRISDRNVKRFPKVFQDTFYHYYWKSIILCTS